jgi:DNA topoisomerase-6 subunit B
MARKQREISVSEFFLKNRHLLGFDNSRKALLTTVKEAVDNALDACEEAGIVPEISVDIQQTASDRFRIAVTDNGPGIVRSQIPRIFAKLLYGSKFHRLRMSRGQQGIGISAAGMYGQLTTGSATRILSKTRTGGKAHLMEVQVDTGKNAPAVLKDEKVDWKPEFPPAKPGRKPQTYSHGTCVSIEMVASYFRGRLSVDEYLKQCAVVNPHLQLHHRVVLSRQQGVADEAQEDQNTSGASATGQTGTEWTGVPLDFAAVPWSRFDRVSRELPEPPREIRPHPHGVELGLLMQMLKSTSARTLRAALTQDFSRVSGNAAGRICERARLNPRTRPSRIAQGDVEALYRAINDTKLMRPPTDCLSPIGEDQILAGLKKEIEADFYTAVTRSPTVYRGNPFQIEAGVAYARAADNPELSAEEPVRLMRYANRVPLLYMTGACAVSKAATGVNWKAYGLSQPRGALPVGPMVILVHMASVWVPFTSESKEAIAHYPEIIREITYALQECGRRLAVYLRRRRRQAEIERKRNYMVLYIPHLAQGLKEILDLSDRKEAGIVKHLHAILERAQLEP